MADDARLTIALVVFDTGPLITLAAADSLDYLNLLNAPVLIPDAVFYEATAKHGALGAQDITAWVQENSDTVRLIPTAVFGLAQSLRANVTLTEQERRGITRNLGERAALEVIGTQLDRSELGNRGLLVLEDNNAARAARLEPEVIPVTTMDFLKTLEAEGRINSADAVLERAENAGRYIARQELLQADHERGMAALRQVMKVLPPSEPAREPGETPWP